MVDRRSALKGQIRNHQARRTGLGSGLAERLHSHIQEGIGVSEQND